MHFAQGGYLAGRAYAVNQFRISHAAKLSHRFTVVDDELNAGINRANIYFDLPVDKAKPCRL